jgi:hypothetical protein
MNRLRTIIMQVGVGLGVMILLYLMAFSLEYSVGYAQNYPELAHMRGPVVFLVICALAAGTAILVLGFLLLERVRRNIAFAPQTVKLLRAIAWIFFGSVLPLLLLGIYTEANVASSITNLYVYGLMALAFMLGNLFMLLAALFQNAVSYKQEVDLTV